MITEVVLLIFIVLTTTILGLLLGSLFSCKQWDLFFRELSNIFSTKILKSLSLYLDYFFPLFLLGSSLVLWFWILNNFSTSDKIQMLLAYGSLAVIVHSVYLRDFSSKRLQPIPTIEFNYSEPDCHLTLTSTGLPTGYSSIPTFYIRARINNKGKSTMRSAQVILEKVEQNGIPLNTFLPLNLTWALTEAQRDRSITDIPQGAFRTLDMVCVFHPQIAAVVADMIPRFDTSTGAKEYAERVRRYSERIEVCSPVKPNTYSDILYSGEYFLYISIASDNSNPVFAKFRVFYDGGWSDDLTDMFTNHLSVVLVIWGTNKTEIFG